MNNHSLIINNLGLKEGLKISFKEPRVFGPLKNSGFVGSFLVWAQLVAKWAYVLTEIPDLSMSLISLIRPLKSANKNIKLEELLTFDIQDL